MRSNKVRDDILSWLVEEGFEVQKGPIPPGAPFDWALLVRVPTPLLVNITVQKPKNFEKVAFTMVVKFSPEHLQAFKERPVKERISLVADILVDMLKLCPLCIVASQPPRLEETEAILATREVLTENLSKATVVDTVRVLANVYQLVVLKIASALEPTKATGGQNSMII